VTNAIPSEKANVIASTKYDLETLHYRRQFILGTRFIDKFSSWQKITINQKLCLTFHPELNVSQVIVENQSLTLLGYILDPDNPALDNAAIINDLSRKLTYCQHINHFFKYTDRLGGRWILVVDYGHDQDIKLFHDAIGARQVVYTKRGCNNELWCASQPNLLTEVLELEIDPQAQDFLHASQVHNSEYWWPGNRTLYRGVKLLLPNHELNLQTGQVIRYWPHQPLAESELSETIKTTSSLLKGVMKSAHQRFPIALPLTAGVDSRLILSACKEFIDQIFIFTLSYWGMTPEHADITVPSKLLAKVGVAHHVIQCPNEMEKEFEAIYTQNVSTAHPVYGVLAQGLYNHYPQTHVCMKGNASAIVKCRELPSFGLSDDRAGIALALAQVSGHNAHPFAVEAFQEWVTGINHLYNLNIWNLFYWELKLGSWQGMSQLEWDIAQEVLNPVNCRALLVQMLSVQEKHRGQPHCDLLMKIIKESWPELLSKPINPHKFPPPTLRLYIGKGLRKIKTIWNAAVHNWSPLKN
jgi:hypothetical protein